jgi:hypothetical protein
MQGKRRDLTEGVHVLEPGEYGKDADGLWWARVPQRIGFYAGMARLSLHDVTEHEDGTITVSPSILVTGHHDIQWHGYLERGVWREV